MKNIKARLENLVYKVSPVRFFAVTALLFGLIFIIITPPFQTPDESVHFYRAYQISELNFVVDNGVNMAGGYLPKALSDTVVLTTTNPAIKSLPNVKYSVRKTIDSFSIKTNVDNKYFFNFPAAAGYSPFSYIPQATGVGIARVFQAPPIAMMYFGRLLNLMAWVVICSVAIHLMPRKKWAIVFLGLLPMSLAQAGSMTTDVMTIGTMLLFFVYILRLRESRALISSRQVVALLIAASLMALTKQVMFIFLPLIFLLPNKSFALKRKAYLTRGIIILVPLILLASWAYVSHGVNVPYAYENGQVPAKQLEFIVHNPHSFINVLWNTNFFTWGDLTFRSFIGSFGAIDTPLSEVIVTIGYMGLVSLLLLNTERKKFREWLKPRQKLLIGAVAILYWAAVSTALYVYFTPVGYKIILGLQGRYFLPVALLAIPLLYGKSFITTETIYRRIAVGTPVFLLLASVITIYVRYYVNNV